MVLKPILRTISLRSVRNSKTHTAICSMHLAKTYYLLAIFSLLIVSPLIGQVDTFSNSSKQNSQVRLIEVIKFLEKNQNLEFNYEGNFPKKRRVPTYPIEQFDNIDLYLNYILKDSGIEYIKLSNISYVLRLIDNSGFLSGKIVDDQKRPLIGATVQVLEDVKGTASDVNGNYKLKVNPGKWTLESRYVGMKNSTKEFTVFPGDSLKMNFTLGDLPYLSEVLIVGPHISNSSILESASPLAIVNAAESRMKSFEGLNNLLQYGSASFFSTPQTIADGTDHIQPATLRGLGPDQLLVLVNGKRRHQSALVNLNGSIGRGSVSTDLDAIPIAAIEKIEILKDGASAHYGSDAIAGVINIQLKKNTNYSDFVLRNGITASKDGYQLGGSFNTGVELNERGGFMNLTFSFDKRNSINRSGDYTGPIYGDARDMDPIARNEFFNHTGFSGHKVMEVGGAAMDNAAMLFNMNLPIRSNSSFYAFGGHSYKEGNSSGFYRFPFEEQKQSGLYPFGFAPILNTNITDQSLSMGFRKNANWKLDVSNTISRNEILLNVENSNNASLLLLSPTNSKVGGFNYLQNVSNIDLTRTIGKQFPVALGLGAEFRVEKFKQEAGEESSWRDYDGDAPTTNEGGFQMFPGFRPDNEIDRYRYNAGIYINAESPTDRNLMLGLAARSTYFSGFGSNVSWNIYSRLRIAEKQAIKGAINTGFRAPSLSQLYFNNYSYQFIDSQLGQEGVTVAHFNNESIANALFGFEKLDAEQSINYSLGYSADLLKGLSFSFNAYQIDIEDRIVLSGRFSSTDDPRFESILENFDVNHAQFFTNAIDTRTRGFDIDIKYQLNLGLTKIKFDLLANFTQTKVKQEADGSTKIKTSPQLEEFKNLIFNREEIGRIERGQPASKILFRTIFSKNKWTASANITRFGEVVYINPLDGDEANWLFNEFTNRVESRDQIFKPKLVTDFNLQYNLKNMYALSIGCNNVFNVFPDKHQHSANTANGIFTYSRRVQQFGIQGAFWYASIGLKI